MKFTHLTALLAATMVSFLMSACGGEPSGGSDADQGVQITKQTVMDLRVVAASGEAKVSITVHRKGVMPAEFIQDPDNQSPYDYDLIVRNRYGFPFVTSGNHGLPDDSDTGSLANEAPTVVNQQHQLDDLKLAIETVEQLRVQTVLGEQYHGELRSLYYMIDSALMGANYMLDNKVVPEATPAVKDVPTSPQLSGAKPANQVTNETVAVVRQAYTAPYTHMVSIKYAPIWWTEWQGDHSAILLYVFDSQNYLVGQVSTRNHGVEAHRPCHGHE